MHIINFVPTRRSNGKIFQASNDTPCNKEEMYKIATLKGVQYFKAIKIDSRLYKNIVGDICTEKPVLLENTGYYHELIGVNNALMAVGCELILVTNIDEVKEVNKRACWC